MTLLEAWFALRDKANAADGDALERLVRAYGQGFARINDNIQALMEQIAELQKSGTVTSAQIKRTATYKTLMREITDELSGFSGYLKTEIRTAANASATQGLEDGTTLLSVAMAIALGVKMLPKGIVKTPLPDTLDFLRDYLDPYGILYDRINQLTSWHAGIISDGILQRVMDGLNPVDIGEWITDAYGMGLTDSLRMMRTVQLYSYRQANNATQVANSDVLQGVVWCAELDDRVCMSCVALHGQVFPVGTIANDHHCGRAEVEGNIILSDDTTALEAIDYVGDIVIISTASGKQLSVTPDHPVLTDRGWLAAAFIHEGDNVISANIGDGTSINVGPDKNHVPTRIEDIPVANGMVFTGVPEPAEYLDSNGGSGKVDAIFIDRLLWDRFNASRQKHTEQGKFGVRHFTGFLSGFSRQYETFNRLCGSNPRKLSLKNTSPALFGGHELIPERIGAGQTHSDNAVSLEYPGDNLSGNTQGFSNGIFGLPVRISGNNFAYRQASDFIPTSSGNFPALDYRTFGGTPKQPMSLEILRQSLLASMPAVGGDFRAITSGIILDGVTKVEIRRFSGHVYSLQTRKEWYYSNGIISHNCAMLPWVNGEPNPIEQNGEDWFGEQPADVQKSMMGAGKFDAWQNGQFEFDKLSGHYQDDIFGDMRREATLGELIGEEQ